MADTTAAQHAKEGRRNVVLTLGFALRYLNEASEWMVTDADVDNEAAAIVAEFGVRIRGLLRRYDPDFVNPASSGETTHVRVIPISELDDAI